nr:hypothetical protein [Tanacetum cinerariifolium]
TAPAALPSPPLLPSLYPPPPVDHRDDIPESKQPPRKMLCLSTLGSRYKVGKSSTWGRGVDYRSILVTELVELHEHDTQDLYTLLEDAQDEWIVHEEAYAAREAWVHSIGLSHIVHHELQTLRETLGPEAYAITWEVLKKKMTDKYCLQMEVRKLEIELWNLKVKGNDVLTYTNRFQELTLICTKFIANENKKIYKYISGIPYSIYGNVKSSKPRMLDETIELTNDLMDQKLRTYTERADNKRKADDTSRSNHGHQQQSFKKQNVAKAYNIGTGERKPYEGSFPKSSGNANVANAQKDSKETPKGNGCFECGALGHFKRDCPKLKNKNEEIRMLKDGCMQLGM